MSVVVKHVKGGFRVEDEVFKNLKEAMDYASHLAAEYSELTGVRFRVYHGF